MPNGKRPTEEIADYVDKVTLVPNRSYLFSARTIYIYIYIYNFILLYYFIYFISFHFIIIIIIIIIFIIYLFLKQCYLPERNWVLTVAPLFLDLTR